MTSAMGLFTNVVSALHGMILTMWLQALSMWLHQCGSPTQIVVAKLNGGINNE